MSCGSVPHHRLQEFPCPPVPSVSFPVLPCCAWPCFSWLAWEARPRCATAWRQQRYVKATNTGAGDVFGSALALSGDGRMLVAGAQLEDGGPAGTRTEDPFLQNSGAVYLYAAR